ncbi:MAG: CPBP family glutamic-type intramembrane protease [Vicinamibacteria bacterium]
MKASLLTVLLALAVAIAAGFGLHDVSLDVALVAALGALFLLLLPYFYFGTAETRPRPSLFWVAALLLPYAVYVWGTGAFDPLALGRLALYLTIPAVLVFLGRHRKEPGAFDFLAVLAIWLPFDLRLLEGIWTWPEGQGSYGFQTVLAVNLAVFLFVLYRALVGIGYRFRLTRRSGVAIAQNFALFSAIAIPLGLTIDFIRYQPRAFDAGGFLGSFLAILLFIGIPEELLFRGLLQNFLDQWWGKGFHSLLAASLVFGAAHLDNDAAPNFSYALLATIAGIFYGRTFRQSGSLLAPAIVHALVDAVWRAFFR